MRITDSLLALSGYPIPLNLVQNILDDVELSSEDECTTKVRQSNPYKIAKAKVFRYLACAPNITQNGISYSITAEDKKRLQSQANELMAEVEGSNAIEYGYIGEGY